MKDTSASRYWLIAAFLQIIWGIVPSASKFVLDEIPVELYIAIRWTISGLLFAGYLTLTRTWRQISIRHLLAVAGLGILGYGVASFGTLYGLKVGGVTNFALIGTIGPVISSVMAILLLRERPLKIFYLALPLAVAGLAMLVIGKHQVSTWTIATHSAALIIGAYSLEALVFVYSKKSKSAMPIAQYLAISQLSTAVLMWSFEATLWHQSKLISNLSWTGWSGLLFVAIVACVFCYLVLYWLLRHMDGHRLSLFDSFHSLSAVIFGYLLFQEAFRPSMIIGGILVLVGILIGNWQSKA